MTGVRTAVVAATVLLALGASALAQRRFFRGPDPEAEIRNVPYDGRFTFVRLRYTTAPDGYWAGGLPSWVHGYPLAERNLMRIMRDISYLDARIDINVLGVDDPELTKYPVSYIIEVGWWTLTDNEAAALRAYMLKGGFVIVDDFKVAGWNGLGGGWEPFEDNMRRVMPGGRFIRMSDSHPIFHSFFEIGSLDIIPQAYNSGRPQFFGLFEDNDPSKRLMMIVNYNTDVSQYWEWSARGLRPVDETNQAYKLGVNYLMYGVTH